MDAKRGSIAVCQHGKVGIVLAVENGLAKGIQINPANTYGASWQSTRPTEIGWIDYDALEANGFEIQIRDII